MFVANNLDAGWANGTMGKVRGFEDDTVLVEILSEGPNQGDEVIVSTQTWKITKYTTA